MISRMSVKSTAYLSPFHGLNVRIVTNWKAIMLHIYSWPIIIIKIASNLLGILDSGLLSMKFTSVHLQFFQSMDIVAIMNRVPINPPITLAISLFLLSDERFDVHPDYRCQGIGADLLIEALRFAASLGGVMATLEVRPSNQAAMHLYEKFGFGIVNRRKNYYQDNREDAWLMKLEPLELAWAAVGGSVR